MNYSNEMLNHSKRQTEIAWNCLVHNKNGSFFSNKLNHWKVLINNLQHFIGIFKPRISDSIGAIK